MKVKFTQNISGTLHGSCSASVACTVADSECTTGGVCECTDGHTEYNNGCVNDGMFLLMY